LSFPRFAGNRLQGKLLGARLIDVEAPAAESLLKRFASQRTNQRI
jgi:hypothetical protein